MSTRVAILGAGDLGQALAHYARVIDDLEIVGFLDDTCIGEQRAGLQVIAGVQQAEEAYERGAFEALLMGIGYHHLDARRRLFERLQSIGFVSLVHPSAYVDPGATIEAGAIIYPGCIVDQGALISRNALLNVGCVVAHDTTVGPHTFLGPGVELAGFIRIGERCFIGVGTTVIDNVTIADGVQTGGGTVVIGDLEPGLWVGNPARKVR